MDTVRIAAAQPPEFLEDVGAALDCAADFALEAKYAGAALLCFPECFLQGYLTDETAARRAAIDLDSVAFKALLTRLPPTGPVIVMGLIETANHRLFNTAVIIQQGTVIGRYRKAHLLERERIFDAGTDTCILDVGDLRFGVNICNDMNFPEAARKIVDGGAYLLVGPANNMLRRKTAEIFRDIHNAVRGERCRETGLWLLSADITGEREAEGRVCWGPTALLDPTGRVVAQLPLGEAGLLVVDIPRSPPKSDLTGLF